MSLENRRTAKTYITVLADGLFHQTVPEGTEGAKVREYEDSKGNKGTKIELTFDTLSGMIEKIFFNKGKFGDSLHVVIDGVDLSMVVSSTFAEDFMKKVPNIDLAEPVSISPYAFKDDKGKERKGLSITQDGEKVTNYFYDPVAKKATNGIEDIPLPKANKKGEISADAWKLYFGQVRMFLVENTEDKYCTEQTEKVEVDNNGFDDIEFGPSDEK